MDAVTTARLALELDRVTNAGGQYTLANGTTVKAATETEAIRHLTSTRFGYYVEGRQFRFPGIGNGWVFDSSIEAAGYTRVSARSSRNLPCNILIKQA